MICQDYPGSGLIFSIFNSYLLAYICFRVVFISLSIKRKSGERVFQVLLCYLIGKFVQSEVLSEKKTKTIVNRLTMPKPIVTRSQALSRASRQKRVFTSSCDWFIGLSVPFVIGQSDLVLVSRRSIGKRFKVSLETLVKHQKIFLSWFLMWLFNGEIFSLP